MSAACDEERQELCDRADERIGQAGGLRPAPRRCTAWSADLGIGQSDAGDRCESGAAANRRGFVAVSLADIPKELEIWLSTGKQISDVPTPSRELERTQSCCAQRQLPSCTRLGRPRAAVPTPITKLTLLSTTPMWSRNPCLKQCPLSSLPLALRLSWRVRGWSPPAHGFHPDLRRPHD